MTADRRMRELQRPPHLPGCKTFSFRESFERFGHAVPPEMDTRVADEVGIRKCDRDCPVGGVQAILKRAADRGIYDPETGRFIWDGPGPEEQAA